MLSLFKFMVVEFAGESSPYGWPLFFLLLINRFDFSNRLCDAPVLDWTIKDFDHSHCVRCHIRLCSYWLDQLNRWTHYTHCRILCIWIVLLVEYEEIQNCPSIGKKCVLNQFSLMNTT